MTTRKEMTRTLFYLKLAFELNKVDELICEVREAVLVWTITLAFLFFVDEPRSFS